MVYTYIGVFSALKRNEILIHANMEIHTNLKNIMLNEASLTQEDSCMISLYSRYLIVKFIETESKTVYHRLWGRRNGKLLFNEYRFSILEYEKLEIGTTDGITFVNTYITELYI